MSEVETLQPWQIFCSMFAVFWLFSAWCDQVLITLLLCIVCGVLCDVITKSIYSAPAQGEKGEPQASAEEKKRSNERIWLEAEAELEEDEEGGGGDVPPPLPAKDYTATTAQNIDSLADKLQALVDRDEATQEQQEEEDEEEDRQPPRQYNRTVSDEYNQNTSAVNYNNRERVIEEEGLGQETINDDDDEDDEDDDNNSEEDGKIYAKDSSDEEDYDYASREVNFNESESATEEEDEANDDGDDREPIKKIVKNTQINLKDDK